MQHVNKLVNEEARRPGKRPEGVPFNQVAAHKKNSAHVFLRLVWGERLLSLPLAVLRLTASSASRCS